MTVFPVRRPEGLRLEIGLREAVEKAVGIVVPDRAEFDKPPAYAFNHRFLVRCKPWEAAQRALDQVLRQRLLGLGEFHILAECGGFRVSLPLSAGARQLGEALDIASSILDALEGGSSPSPALRATSLGIPPRATAA